MVGQIIMKHFEILMIVGLRLDVGHFHMLLVLICLTMAVFCGC